MCDGPYCLVVLPHSLVIHCFSLITDNSVMCMSDAVNYDHDVAAWLINSGIVSLSCKLL